MSCIGVSGRFSYDSCAVQILRRGVRVRLLQNKLAFATAVTIVVFFAISAFAVDVTGSWTGEAKGPNGESFPLTFAFKQDGAKLTGTVTGPQGDPIEISNGKMDGDKISFDVSFNGMTIQHAGTVSGDEIKLTTKSDQFPGGDMTLKRAK